MTRRTLLVWLCLPLLGVASSARAQDGGDALGDLSRRVTELRADANRSYLRMRLLADDLLGDRDGGRARITLRDDTGSLFSLVAATVALDGEPLLSEVDPTGGLDDAELPLLDGAIAPGEHTLSVVLRYRGEGLGVVGYMPGYRFVLRSSYSFVAGRGEDATEIVVRPYSDGPLVPYEERLRIEYEQP